MLALPVCPAKSSTPHVSGIRPIESVTYSPAHTGKERGMSGTRRGKLTSEHWDFTKELKHASVKVKFMKKFAGLMPMAFAAGAIKKSYKAEVNRMLEAARGETKKPKGVVGWARSMPWLLVTPAMAKLLLLYRRENREMVPGAIRRYVDQIFLGQWSATGQPIILDTDDRVVDGQQRLAAIIETKKPVAILFVRGIPESAFTFMDNGVARTAKHLLEAYRDRNGNPLDRPGDLSNAITLAIRYARASKTKNHSMDREGVEPQLPLTAFKAHKQFSDLSLWHKESRKAFSALGLTPGVSICAMFFTCSANRDKSYDFWEGVSTGINLKKTSPVLALRNFLIKEIGAEEKPRSFMERSLAATAIAWNLCMAGTRCSERLKVKLQKDDQFPTFNGGKRAVNSILNSIGELK